MSFAKILLVSSLRCVFPLMVFPFPSSFMNPIQEKLTVHVVPNTFLCDSEIPKLEPGSSVTGTIDAKFDYGYVVTVNLGTQKYKGVLYHASAAPGPTPRERRRHQLGLKDPSRPRPNMSGYNFFFQEHYCRLKPSYQGQERAISKKIGVLWNRLSEAEKQVESTLCLGKPLFSCTFKRKFAVLIALFQSF